MTVQWVTVVLDRTTASGTTLSRGAASIVPSAQLPVAGQMLIGMQPVVARFGQDQSPPSVRLASSDSVAPFNAWTYDISFPGVPGALPFSFYLNSANGSTQYLSALVPVPVPAPAPGSNADGGSAVTGQLPVLTYGGGGAVSGQYPVADIDGGSA